MTQYKLSYAKLGAELSGEDIPVFEFSFKESMRLFVETITRERGDIVWLALVGDEVLITERGSVLRVVFSGELGPLLSPLTGNVDSGIYEFKSYEEAYKMALMIKESSHLCYKDGYRAINNAVS